MVAGLALSGPADGASRFDLRAATIEVAGLRAQDVEVSVQPLAGPALATEIRAGHLEGIEALGTASGLRIACPRLEVSDAGTACPAGALSGRSHLLGQQDTPARFRFAPDGQWWLELPALALAGGSAALDAHGRGSEWSCGLQLSGTRVEHLVAIPAIAAQLPPDLGPTGSMGGQLRAQGSGGQPDAVALALSLSSLAFADAAGQLAGEKLALDIRLAASRIGAADRWQLDADLAASAGQAYFEPVFLDFGARPARVELKGALEAVDAALTLSHFGISQEGVGTAEGVARLRLAGEPLLHYVRARLRGVALAGAWPAFGAPWTVGTQWSDLIARGTVDGEIDIEDGTPGRIDLQLDDVTLDSVTGSLAVAGLGGRLSWYSDRLRDALAPGMDSAVFKSSLHWTAARLWGIEFGTATIPFTTTGRHFRLLEPVVLPVFDGGLAIDTLRLRHAGTPRMYLRFDAALTPVSLRLLTRSLGWPEFGGTLSGRIPRLELAEGFVTLGGNIEAAVFDGHVTVRNLRLRDPLGEYPQLFADLDVERLDLEQVTSTFEFGMITGRLSGRIERLETFDWVPVSFDAGFYSTPGDRSQRRIDQRAVSNLSSIGGGSGGSVTAALQGGFLRFFDSFRYDRLGLSCRLANDVCHMDGVAPAEGGYYIVKGSGLPRIDVIGNQRRVAWTRLVRQLAAIIESPGPVVE